MAREPRFKRQVRTEFVTDAGEVVALTHMEPVGKHRPPDKREAGRFALAYVENLTGLAQLKLTGVEHAVLLCLVARMGFDEPFHYSNADIAAELGTAPPNVSIAVRKLKDAGVLIPFEGRTVMIDPNLYWRGTKQGRMTWLANVAVQRQKIRAADAAGDHGHGAAPAEPEGAA